MKTLKILPLIFSLLFAGPTFAQSLSAGDIAFTGYNSRDVAANNLANLFSFVVLRPGGLVNGTHIFFTDNGWNTITSALGTTEGTIDWVSGTVPQYTVVVLQTTIAGTAMLTTSTGSATVTGTFILSQAGDQVLAYQGTAATPSFISGIHMNSEIPNGTSAGSSYANWDDMQTGGWTFSANRSGKPSALTTGVNAVMPVINPGIAAAEKDNGKFDCNTNGSASSLAALRTAINDPTKWITNDAVFYPLPTPGCVYSAGILPVTLSRFEGTRTNAGNVLKWKTETEQSIRSYAVERSEDGITYTIIGTVSARNMGTSQEYQYTDSKTTGTVYYRLRINDQNGETSYSKVVKLNSAKSAETFIITPNPVSGNLLQITSELNYTGQLRFTVFDLAGREYKTGAQYSRGNGAEQVFKIDISSLPVGINIIKISDEEGKLIQTLKFKKVD